MSAIPNELPVELPKAASPAPVLRTLVICDLADSTALVEKLGDQRTADIMRQHDRVARDLVEHHGGREIDKTDGFLILFDRPVQAVAFALDYQRALRALGVAEGQPLAARIGIHVGDVVIWDNDARDIARGAKPVEVEGLVKPTAARIMSIARPGQILVSGMASTLAQRARSEIEEGLHVRWRAHGHYRFKGLPEPVQVHEVGEEGIAPFRAPAWSGKAHREIPWWRRPGMLFVEVAIVIAALGVPAYFALRSAPAIAFAERDWVVVGDLKNLTGENALSDSLQSAFRIGLEQSRYVNALSDLKARDTLKLMQRDPDKTLIDRETGSEIAIREGVRALILPSIAEIGGRVRITAEVVDPHTQTTVYSESADGKGMESVLPSIDKVNAQLRARLGEALATVSNESQPLERVATKSLDALRAYTLGDKAYDLGDLKNAIQFFDQAIKLDPDFARAKLWLSISYYNINKFDEASKAISSALSRRDRLTPRDILFAEAWQSTMSEAQPAAIEKWKNLARLYPDLFVADRFAATFSWWYANSFGPDVIAFAQASASPQNPHRNISEHLLGELYLGNESYGDSEKHFAAVTPVVIGNSLSGDHAKVFAAQRKFNQAEALLGGNAPLNSKFDFDFWRSVFAINIDRGNWTAAWQQLDDMNARFAGSDGPELWYARTMAYALRALRSGQTQRGADLQSLATTTEAAINGTSGIERTHRVFAMQFLAYLAAHDKDTQLAARLLAAMGSEPISGNYPMLAKMQSIVRAEIARVQGDPATAVKLLQPELNGSELYLTRYALMEAYAATDDWEAAHHEAQWLTVHRGRAYAETTPQELLLPYNTALSDLAWLNMAEYSLKMSDASTARNALKQFLLIWPSAAKQKTLDERIKVLQTALH